MKLWRAWLVLLWHSYQRLLWSKGSLLVLLPIVGISLQLLWRGPGNEDFSPQAFEDYSRNLVLLVLMSVLVPLVALAYATASVGADREDRTLVYLLVMPIPRTLILLAKLCAALPLAVGVTVGSFWFFTRISGALGALAWQQYLPGVFLASLAYTGLFLLLAALFRHATVVALVYGLFVELILANMPGIIKHLTVNYYGRSLIFAAGEPFGLRRPDPQWFEPISTLAAERTLVGIFVVCSLLALVVFARKEYRDLT